MSRELTIGQVIALGAQESGGYRGGDGPVNGPLPVGGSGAAPPRDGEELWQRVAALEARVADLQQALAELPRHFERKRVPRR